MEKYAVKEDEQYKLASESDRSKCPKCQNKLNNTNQTNVLVCPKCGTEPFENESAD